MTTFGERENRTRVTCNLPLNDAAQEKAFKEVIRYLQSQRDQRIGITGYTYSAPGTFYGFWWNEERDGGNWEPDKIVLLIIDYEISLEHPIYTLSEKLSELKTTISRAYEHYGSAQLEVWVIANTVDRYL